MKLAMITTDPATRLRLDTLGGPLTFDVPREIPPAHITRLSLDVDGMPVVVLGFAMHDSSLHTLCRRPSPSDVESVAVELDRLAGIAGAAPAWRVGMRQAATVVRAWFDPLPAIITIKS